MLPFFPFFLLCIFFNAKNICLPIIITLCRLQIILLTRTSMDMDASQATSSRGGSPPRRRRRPNTPTSSSVKRKKVKANPCSFCHRVKDVFSLQDHLEENVHCKNLYMRYLKVSKMDQVLVRVFDCLFCSAKFCKITDHLRTHQTCKDAYFLKFGVNDIK